MRVINNLGPEYNRIAKPATPAIPLPNPGEGGAVFPGNGSGEVNGETDDALNDIGSGSNNVGATPTIPLPNPGEGGAVFPGNSMNGNNAGNNTGNNTGAIPVIPLPNPGEGGAVFPGNGMNGNNTGSNMGGTSGGNITVTPSIPGTVIITYPRPNENCSFCNPGSNRNGKVRFLNTASGYNPFWVYINDKLLVNDFGFGDITEYVDVATGAPVITLMGSNGYVYLQQPVEVNQGENMTVAIVNTASGLGLKMISDTNCDRTRNMSCIRVGNLTYSGSPLNVTIGNQYINFRNVNSGEVTDFATTWPGEYMYTVSRSNNPMYSIWGGTALLRSVIYMQQDKNYTVYLFQYNPSSDAIKAVIVED